MDAPPDVEFVSRMKGSYKNGSLAWLGWLTTINACIMGPLCFNDLVSHGFFGLESWRTVFTQYPRGCGPLHEWLRALFFLGISGLTAFDFWHDRRARLILRADALEMHHGKHVERIPYARIGKLHGQAGWSIGFSTATTTRDLRGFYGVERLGEELERRTGLAITESKALARWRAALYMALAFLVLVALGPINASKSATRAAATLAQNGVLTLSLLFFGVAILRRLPTQWGMVARRFHGTMAVFLLAVGTLAASGTLSLLYVATR